MASLILAATQGTGLDVFFVNPLVSVLPRLTLPVVVFFMDKLFKNYIDEPGTYTSLPEGNTLIRCDGVVLQNVTTGKDRTKCIGSPGTMFLSHSDLNANFI